MSRSTDTMPATSNLFDYFDELSENGGAGAHWAARTPLRPDARFDIKLVPRSPGWKDDPIALDALERVEREPWAAKLSRGEDGARLRLEDGWIEALGAALQDGDGGETKLADLAQGRR